MNSQYFQQTAILHVLFYLFVVVYVSLKGDSLLTAASRSDHSGAEMGGL